MPIKNDKKIIVILGPTASGKTKLAVELAEKFNGEIVSADSRQVYRGMDIGTGKDLKDYRLEIPNPNDQLPNKFKIQNSKLKIIEIPYHLIDVANPKEQFDLAQYQKMAFRAIDDILKRGKLPILAGGSGLYLQAVVENYKLSEAKKDLALRKKLEKLSAAELFNKLKKLVPKMAVKLNQSDKNNKRRLIRYLEIVGQDHNFKSRAGKRKYNALIIGVNFSRDILKQRIFKRLLERLKEQNMIGEVERLHEQGLSWKRLEDFGLEYKFVSLYLEGELQYEEMVEKLNLAIYQFAKRQMTWFKRWEKQGANINWVKDNKKIEKLVKDYLEKR
ncbi:MAG: tRNA (adenosine(37)-N6)-dimethylallyltransferase MiaA [Parcubacteria group bacterium CG2_30_45_37]|nr:MAG: tRNA (adenosine(37)-N6)-dimethylallyltransferase MiaA [Parcubacteria group bacterium CG2_30_45_37]